MAPHQTPKWPRLPTSRSVLTRRPFLFQVLVTPVPSCPGGLMGQLKGEKFTVVQSTAYGFRAAVSALRSLDGKDGVIFHTFTFPGDRCARRLVKNLGRGMPESVVTEELKSLNFSIQGVTELRSGPRQGEPPPTPHFSVSVARGPEVSIVRSLTELCSLRVSVESCVSPKGPLQCKRCQSFGHPAQLRIRTPVRRLWGLHLSGGCSTPREQLQCCGCRGNHTANYRGCVK